MKQNCFFLCLLLLGLAFLSCAHSPKPLSPSTDNSQSFPVDSDSYRLQQLTDQLLLALANHDYPQLQRLIGPDHPQLSGSDAAQKLLGPLAQTVILDHWDAQQTQVSFDASLLHATARIPVFYRAKPNRNPVKTSITFHFYRLSSTDSWKLQLPE